MRAQSLVCRNGHRKNSGGGVMERLTEKHYGANDYYMTCSAECERDQCVECAELEKIVNLLGAYEDTGLTPAEIRSMRAEVERLKALAIADEEGRVVVLPCKVGDTVYMISWRLNGRHEIEERVFSLTYFDPAKYGKDYFLSREEAEKALEAWKDG
nr:MAG TPA: hypothetical protein [Caudoviricetes sp.]